MVQTYKEVHQSIMIQRSPLESCIDHLYTQLKKTPGNAVHDWSTVNEKIQQHFTYNYIQ